MYTVINYINIGGVIARKNVKRYYEAGEFKILIGKSSRDIILKEVVTLKSTVEIKYNEHVMM